MASETVIKFKVKTIATIILQNIEKQTAPQESTAQ